MVDIILPATPRDSLPAAIQSVVNQTYQDWTLYVVGDGFDPYVPSDSRIRKLIIDGPHNDSGTAARRAGIAAGHGGLIAYIDSDDEWLRSHLESLLTFAIEGNHDVVHSHGQQFKFSRGRKKVSGIEVKDPTTVSILHTRDIYIRTNGWQNIDNHDHQLWKQMVDIGASHAILPVVTYHFYRGKR